MQSTNAVTLRALHRGDRVLVLPNAWDAASAAFFASAGAAAIATTSAGAAWACGYPDGDLLPHASLLFSVAAICRVAGELPVSVDLESGFSADPAAVAGLACELCALGVAGINLEDGASPPDVLAAKIAAIRRAVGGAGSDLFVNARTDVFLRDLATGEEAVREAQERLRRYAAAGADGAFVPGLARRDEIERVARATALPLSLMAVPDLPSSGELYALGVRRLSAGPALAKLAYGRAREAAASFLHEGSARVLFGEPIVGYDEVNALLGGVEERLRSKAQN